MKLIKKQAELLKLEREKLKKEWSSLKNAMAQEKEDSLGAIKQDSTFSELKKQVVINDARIKEINNILEDAEIVDKPSGDIIDIGSEVEIFMDFGDGDFEFITFTLIEKKVGIESSDDFITIESELGKAIYKKTTKDRFSYSNTNNDIMQGIIMSCNEDIVEKNKTKRKTK